MVERAYNCSRSKRLILELQLFIINIFQMSYISHVDYKSMMENFKKGTPKSMLKEDFERPSARETEEENELGRITDAVERVFAKDSLTSRDTVDDLAEDIRNAWSKSRGYGQGDEIDFVEEYLMDWANEERAKHFQHNEEPSAGTEQETIWGDNWKNWIHTATNSIEEGNAFTAGLAKAKKGEEFKVDGKSVKDTSNYDAPVKEYQFDDKYPEDPGPFEEEVEKEVKKMQEIAGVKSHDDGPEDDDDEEREARAKKAETDDEEAENAEREIDEEEEGKPNMHSDRYVAKVVAQKHGAELKKLRAAYDEALKGGYTENNKAISKAWKDYENAAISWAGHEMLEAGMNKVAVRNLLSAYGYFEDWVPDYLQALGEEMKGMAEGLHMPPLQATGQTIMTNEDQAPYGMSVLSPDERNQLKEYITHYRTIKAEITKLLEKAGKSGKIMEGIKEDEAVPAARKATYKDPTTVPTQKHKHSNLGGDRTGLVMTKAEMWENEGHEDEAHERMEGLLDQKLHDAFHKVTGMIMKDLMNDGFNEGDIKLFLQHEIEEKAKEANLSQYDPH